MMGGMAAASEGLIESFREFEAEDCLEFSTGGESFTCMVRRTYTGSETMWMVVCSEEGRLFKIETHWANGWLEPLVDEYMGSTDEVVPVGCLKDVSRVGPQVDG